MATPSLVSSLIAVGVQRRVEAGEILCRQGELSDSAFVVIEGTVETLVEPGAAATHGSPELGSPEYGSPERGITGQSSLINEHGPGSLVGEITALVGGHRSATLRAASAGIISEVAGGDVRSVLDRSPEEAAELLALARARTDRSRVINLLSEELHPAEPAMVRDLADLVTWTHLAAGQMLFEAGAPADAAYLVLSGRLEVSASESPTSEANPVARREVGRGGIVGEFGLLDDRPRAHTVRALRDTELARLAATDFELVATRHHGLAMGLVRRILLRSGDDVALGNQSARSVCVVVTAPGVDARLTTTKMVDAVAATGATAHLTGPRVDVMLGADGASAAQSGDVGSARLMELLHQSDADHEHVVLEGHRDHEGWTRTAISHADQVVVVCSAAPGSQEDAEIQRIVEHASATPVWLALDHPAGTERPHGTAALQRRYGVAEVHHTQALATSDLARVARLAVGRGIGVVLSGGGARGFAHLGVIEALEEHGVPIDRIAGASMGSVIAAAIAQRIAAGDRIETVQSQFLGLLDYTIPVVSLVKGERITANIEQQFGGYDIEDLWLPFSCVSTNLTTAEVVPHRSGPVATAVRASVAIPGVLPPVPSGESLLIDGGVLDNLPVSLMIDDPSVGTLIAVDVTPPLGPRARADYGLSVSGWAALRDRIGSKKNQYPGLAAVLMRTMLIGSNRDRDRTVQSGRIDCYLDLELRGIGLLEFDTVAPVAERGYAASVDRIGDWWSSVSEATGDGGAARTEEVGHVSAHTS